MAELSPDFVDAGWDEIDLTDAYQVLDDALDYMDDQGYLGPRGGGGGPIVPPEPPGGGGEPIPESPRKRRRFPRIRKFFRRIFGR